MAAAFFLLLVGAAPAPSTSGKITAIEVRLFDPVKAEFTANVLKEGLYAGWNTFMLEGNAGYDRGDAMVLVKVAVANPDALCCIIKSPLRITATRNEKLIARRTFTNIRASDGEVTRALYLQDIGCTGEIDIRAELAGRSRIAKLVMSCGE